MKKIIATLSVLLISLPTSATDIQTTILENYAKPAQFIDIKISPKGSYLAATARDNEGSVQLSVLDIKNFDILSVTQSADGESVNSFNWVNDKRLVITMAREVGALDIPAPTGELFAMNADGSRKTVLTGPRSRDGEYVIANVVDWLPNQDDRIMIYTASMFESDQFLTLWEVDVDSGAKRRAGRIPIRAGNGTSSRVLVDQAGDARVATGVIPADNNAIVIMARDGANEDWYEIMRYHEDDGGFAPITIMPNGYEVMGLSNSETDTQSISIYNLKTRTEEVVATHPDVDLEPLMSIRDGYPNDLIGAWFEYDKIDAVFFQGSEDDDFAQVVQSLMATFPGRSVSVNSATKDANQVILRVASANDPATFYLFDRQARKLTPIAQAQPWLKKEQIPTTQTIVYEAKDGTKITALLTLPRGQEAKKLPLILLPHGGPHGIRETIGALDTDAKVLATHGYAVLQPNFRGSGGFGLEFQSAGYRKWGTLMIDDMTAGVDYLIEQGIADPERMCTYGASYGAYAALMSVIREPNKYNCAIGFVGVYDLDLMFEEGDTTEVEAGQNFLAKIFHPDASERHQQSPVHRADEVTVPVFLIHGEKDRRAPLTHAKRLRAKFDELGHDYEWMTKEEEGHGFYKPENNIERWTRMLEFLDKHIDAE
ncbi:MAG TPA: prolyl oligopeptidase family serine peptidase [Pseudidiomarina sp.]|nr:prolyl oligopeptidase family serine peptidase [Pseudidiomarina sp.]